MPLMALINCKFKRRNTPSAAKPIQDTGIIEQQDERGFLNLYKPGPSPLTYNECTPAYLYDINFVFPFHILETDHVRLEPFIPSKHLKGFLSLPDDSWNVLGDLGPYDKLTALEDIEEFRDDENSLLMAVIDKQVEAANPGHEGAGFAGISGLTEVDPETMSAVYGLVNIHSTYQRTHINTHAMYLSLTYLFDHLGLLRVQYDAVTFAEASIRAAIRFGFKEEGICRNLHGIVPVHKKRKGEECRQSQDLWLSSMTIEDWDKGAKENLEEMMRRPVVDTRKRS